MGFTVIRKSLTHSVFPFLLVTHVRVRCWEMDQQVFRSSRSRHRRWPDRVFTATRSRWCEVAFSIQHRRPLPVSSVGCKTLIRCRSRTPTAGTEILAELTTKSLSRKTTSFPSRKWHLSVFLRLSSPLLRVPRCPPKLPPRRISLSSIKISTIKSKVTKKKTFIDALCVIMIVHFQRDVSFAAKSEEPEVPVAIRRFWAALLSRPATITWIMGTTAARHTTRLAKVTPWFCPARPWRRQ